jgi:hypothetical protein
MNNQDFIDFVIGDKKLPYDANLLNLLWNYFTIAIQTLETRIDFDYMNKAVMLTVLANNNTVNITDNVKYIKSVYNTTTNSEVYGAPTTKDFYLLLANSTLSTTNPNTLFTLTAEQGLSYYYDNATNTLNFSMPLPQATTFVVDYYFYTYNDPNYISQTASHPILTQNFELLNTTMSVLIERYYTPNIQIDAQLQQYFETMERARQEQSKYSKALIVIDYPRY